ncbi:hypothetical protein Tco_1006725 [Tanacetum coccineum]|uniref:Uncharacterized protein n=1 Tax=Tanacetum coccineum TaxID=301880 RepID=A0ABQ5FKG5_9ASTR
MHNNIMAAGSKERPPMLGPGRYSQWHSRFLRYLDTKSNGEYLRKCIFDGPYMPTNVLIAAVEAAENILPVAAHEEVETIHNMTAENKLYFQAEKEAIFLILTGIGDEIYSTVDACNTAKEMWTAIERLQQGESLNVQDVKLQNFECEWLSFELMGNIVLYNSSYSLLTLDAQSNDVLKHSSSSLGRQCQMASAENTLQAPAISGSQGVGESIELSLGTSPLLTDLYTTNDTHHMSCDSQSRVARSETSEVSSHQDCQLARYLSLSSFSVEDADDSNTHTARCHVRGSGVEGERLCGGAKGESGEGMGMSRDSFSVGQGRVVVGLFTKDFTHRVEQGVEETGAWRVLACDLSLSIVWRWIASKRQKTKPNDKTDIEKWKTVPNPAKVPKWQSQSQYSKNQQSKRSRTEEYCWTAHLNPSEGRKPIVSIRL